LERADDRALWEYAREHGYVIVTKDDDFVRLQLLLGYPPKVILLRLGNCTTQQVLTALVSSQCDIDAALISGKGGIDRSLLIAIVFRQTSLKPSSLGYFIT
jgi:predicted nuclease of predicted toxin-antitoxin system